MSSTFTELEGRIAARARDFDPGPLLAVLEEAGYGKEEILLESNPEPPLSKGLVEAVRFERRPLRRVVVTLNAGLLGPDPLVPSYFLEALEQMAEPERLQDFLRFFDHQLLSERLRVLYPERDPELYRDWAQVKRAYFAALGVRSLSTLEWLFQLHFPELGVSVRRRRVKSSTDSHRARTGGEPLDGSTVLGSTHDGSAAGFRVLLFAEEETDDRGELWPHLIKRRLKEDVFPLLAPFGVYLAVVLQVAEHSSWVRFQRSGYLGYERLRDREGRGHRVVIFSGLAMERALR